MTQVQAEFKIKGWLDHAFRGDIPQEISELMEHHCKQENIFEELMTQLPEATRPVMESLYEMHKADTAMTFRVIEALFNRHLEDHPR